MRRRVQIDTFARNWASNFHSFAQFRIVSRSFAQFRVVSHSFAQFRVVSHSFAQFRIVLIKEYGPYGPQGPWAHKTKMFLLSSYYVVIIILIMMIQGQGQGPGAKARTQKRRGPGPGTGPAPFLGPWPLGSLAQSMHKSVVHPQAIYLLCIHKRFFCVYTINHTSTPLL